MRKSSVLAVAVILLAACGSDATPQGAVTAEAGTTRTPQGAATADVGTSRTPQVSESPDRSAGGSSPQAPDSPAADPAVTAFCDYLESTAQEQLQVEDPMDFVELVEGAAQLAPPAVADDATLFALSIRKLALAIVGDAGQSRAANRWLERNDAEVRRAEADLEAYTQQACGRPFITGEGS